MSELARRLFEMPGSYTRIAFGANLFVPAEGTPQAYEFLQQFIDLKLDPARSTDLTLRINQPRDVDFAKPISVNRLMTWFVLHVSRQRIGPPGVPVVAPPGQTS